MTTKEQIKAIIKQYADKGDRLLKEAYGNGDHASTTGFWEGFKNCAENLLRELEDIQEEPKFKVGDLIRHKTLKIEGRISNISEAGEIDVDCGVYKEYSIKVEEWEFVEEQEPRYPSFEESQGECHLFQDIALNGKL